MQPLNKQLAKIRKFFTALDKDYEWAYEQVGLKDKEKCDIEHELELSDMPYREACKWGTKLRNVLKERRVSKDTVELLEPLHEFVESDVYRSFFKGLETLQGQIRKVEDKLGNRAYRARVRDDLSIIEAPDLNGLIEQFRKDCKERRR